MGTSGRRVQISAGTLKNVYKKLFSSFGPQQWWPAKTSFEVAIGAILVQNTNWENAKKAIENLRKTNILSPKKLNEAPCRSLSLLIKPAGYFNVKARRLKNFINFLFQEYQGRMDLMGQEQTGLLRDKLLTVNGIGPETADSILLYAFQKPIFVVDAYTKRIFLRHQWIDSMADYHMIQELFMNFLKPNQKMFNEYHALLVHLAKKFCKTKPLCSGCPLDPLRPTKK